MAGDRYPAFYLRKRQRDLAYRKVSFFVGCAAFALVGCLAGYWVWRFWIAPAEGDLAANALAEERQQLETSQLLSQAGDRPAQSTASGDGAAGVEPEAAPADLSELEYEQSFPPIHVEVSADEGEGSATGPATGQEGAAGAPDDQGAGTGGETSAGTAEADEAAGAREEPAEEAAPAADPSPAREGPAPAPPQRESEPTAPPAEEPAESDNGAEENGPGTLPPADAAGYIYHVYAGSFSSREQAEAVKGDLSALGYMATLVVLEPDYLLRVATLSDFNAADALKNKLADSGFSSAFATRSRR